MKTHIAGLAVAALLVAGSTLSGFAEDAATPPTPPVAATATPKPDAPPPSVPRPSIVPKTVEPISTPAATEAAPRHRRYADRHRHRWGSYRTAYWEPFPIWWPHFHHNRIHWTRIPWLINF